MNDGEKTDPQQPNSSWTHYRLLLRVLKIVFADSELEEDSAIRKFRVTAADDKNHNTKR